jgi:hypothetical protein
MRKTKRFLTAFALRIRWVVVAKVVLSMVILAYAATISVTLSTYQAEMAAAVKVTNGLRATDKGFTLATLASSPTGTSCSSPVTFGLLPGTANTQLNSGHLVYDAQINSTTTAPASTKFNVTFVLAGTTYGPLCIQTTASPADGQTIDCKYDVGATLPGSPYSFKVVVQ